jgi:uncharacterized protein (TIGR02452 family)
VKAVADETLAIIENGGYATPSGRAVVIRAEIDAAVAGTRLYTPEDLKTSLHVARADVTPRIEVTRETTAQAGRRLVQKEGIERVVALNFASAKNPGGGFLSGAKAQEEDLARCSALYPCQIGKRAYYDSNRASGSMLYTDHMIYSPDVPFFRDDALVLLEQPFLLSIITAPAPNAGEAAKRVPSETPRVSAALRSRARKVLEVAARHDHRCLVLGAWGCGVFRNDPREVADVFATWLAHEELHGAFERVVFAVYDTGKDSPRYRAFVERFA